MTKEFGVGRPRKLTNTRAPLPCFLPALLALILAAAIVSACGLKNEGGSIPPEVESLVGTVTDDIAAERYDKIYNESATQWKQDSTLQQSTDVFKTLRSKLGKVENRVLHSATEQNNSGGPLQGRAYILSYQTKFERGEAMETFTIVEQGGQWRLARYLVNSTALK
jgi:hypothetical protein